MDTPLITKKKILICDDNKSILDLSSVILKKANYDVVTIEEGNELIHSVNFNMPDLILLDLRLPGVNTKALISYLKTNIKTKYIPIITFSAEDEAYIQQESIYADGYIRKPFKVQELVSMIDSVINKS